MQICLTSKNCDAQKFLNLNFRNQKIFWRFLFFTPADESVFYSFIVSTWEFAKKCLKCLIFCSQLTQLCRTAPFLFLQKRSKACRKISQNKRVNLLSPVLWRKTRSAHSFWMQQTRFVRTRRQISPVQVLSLQTPFWRKTRVDRRARVFSLFHLKVALFAKISIGCAWFPPKDSRPSDHNSDTINFPRL